MVAADSMKHWRSLLIAIAILSMSFFVSTVTVPRAAAAGPTYIRGAIVIDTTWDTNGSPYIVTGDVTVRGAATLTILPGTEVRFDPTTTLYVDGGLFADGASFGPNSTLVLTAWRGLQFNATGFGSVSSSTFTMVERAVSAFDSSPMISNNTITTASIGFVLVRSSGVVQDNTVRRAFLYGVYLIASSAQVLRNRINGTVVAIQAESASFPVIANNTITNLSGSFTVGVYVTNGVEPVIRDNVIQGVSASRGAIGGSSGAAGGDGGIAVGILVDSAPSATIYGNTVNAVYGGRGGDGRENVTGVGGRGGNGGPAAGIVISSTPIVDIDSNNVTNLVGGRGGNGGGSLTTTTGGRGGNGGAAIAVDIVDADTSARSYNNSINGVGGGFGGNGGAGSAANGNGGNGGDADGILFWSAMGSDATGNSIQNLRGGLGGNSTASASGRYGGTGGPATAFMDLGVAGTNTFRANTVSTVTGGDGGLGISGGGAGGNATGIFAFGNNDGQFNLTSASSNQIQGVAGGSGGMGMSLGGAGGTSTGVTMALISASLASNSFWMVQGGAGGDAASGSNGGRGGDATAVAAILVPSGTSQGDFTDTVTKGAMGSGPPAQVSYGVGYYMAGNASVMTRLTIENGTLANVDSEDLYVDNYTEATTINTPFSGTKLAVEAAGNLTVKNFLGVKLVWPNGVALVAGASILVEDNGFPVWNFASATGQESWLLVTDRVYINSSVATDNTTRVDVGYSSYNFLSDPRLVDMSTTHTETFLMIDSDAPSSAASPLPSYENTLTFNVSYAASDGNGIGLQNVTLYYRKNGTGGWTADATQPAASAGQFAFTASGDGVYEFATIADDLKGNTEAGPSANDTWTIVDMTRPGSFTQALPTWTISASFTVRWAPDSGVSDISSYTIQYDRGSGWVTWLTNTTQTSATFTASPASGVYQFRSIAKDYAGNVEVAPAGNDSWTIVDVEKPSSIVVALPVYENSLAFVVSWQPQFDSLDIATYRIEVNDDGGGWTVWIPSASSLSASFNGVDGHTFQFRSIATDFAGNVEQAPAGNDSWTIVDVTPPDSAVSPLQPYYTSLTFAVSWGPVAGATDIATYAVEVSDNGSPWTTMPGAGPGTTTVSASFTGQDGHRYAFRSTARDRAGNLETPPAGNDTWTIVDVTPPAVVDRSPRGSDVSTSPSIVIVFSEPMNHASAEQALTITPDINGASTWSADSRTMTFAPARPLQAGTQYVVVLDTGARDLAGNRMVQPVNFAFTTAAASFSLGDAWPYLVLAAIAIGGALSFLLRRRAPKPASPPVENPALAASGQEAAIDDVFLLYRKDGILIKHETRRLRPDIDTDILSGMLTAVQQFVKDSFQDDAYEGELNEITFGEMHLHIGRGKWLIIAARISGGDVASMNDQIKKCIQDMEDHNWDRLEDWDGDVAIGKVLTPYLRKLIRSEYA